MPGLCSVGFLPTSRKKKHLCGRRRVFGRSAATYPQHEVQNLKGFVGIEFADVCFLRADPGTALQVS